jgi:hypothetical protein
MSPPPMAQGSTAPAPDAGWNRRQNSIMWSPMPKKCVLFRGPAASLCSSLFGHAALPADPLPTYLPACLPTCRALLAVPCLPCRANRALPTVPCLPCLAYRACLPCLAYRALPTVPCLPCLPAVPAVPCLPCRACLSACRACRAVPVCLPACPPAQRGLACMGLSGTRFRREAPEALRTPSQKPKWSPVHPFWALWRNERKAHSPLLCARTTIEKSVRVVREGGREGVGNTFAPCLFEKSCRLKLLAVDLPAPAPVPATCPSPYRPPRRWTF